MKCPKCGHTNTSVEDSRSALKDTVIRRRRKCLNCNEKFTTYERVERYIVKVIKNDGRREDFSQEKIRKSINIACQKRKISQDTIEGIIKSIERTIENLDNKEIESKAIGGLVMEALKKIDPVAYVRFASVYLDFTEPEGFIKEASKFIEDDKYKKR